MTSLIALAHPVLLAASTTKKTSSGSSLFLVFLVVIAAAFYFFFMRPQQKKQRQQRQIQSNISEGDEVVTVGGIVGRVLKMDEDRVHLVTGYHAEAEVGDHGPHHMTFVRNAISRKIEPEIATDTSDDGTSDGFAFEQDGAEPATAGNGHGDLSYLENGHVDGRTLDDDPDAESEDDAASSDATDEAPGTAAERRRRGRGRAAGGGSREGTSQ